MSTTVVPDLKAELVSIPYRVHAITDLTRVCLLFRPSIADFLGFFKVFPFDLFLGNGFMAGFWRI